MARQGLEPSAAVFRPLGIEPHAAAVDVEVRAGQMPQLPQPQAGKEGHFVKQSTLRRRHHKNGGDVFQGQGTAARVGRGVEPAETGQRVAGQVAAVDAPAAE